MNESNIVKGIQRYLKTVPECFFWKEHGGMYGTAGIPDIICCYRGLFIGLEVKTKTGQLTKLQEVMIRRIREAGGRAYKVTSVDDVKTIFENMEG